MKLRYVFCLILIVAMCVVCLSDLTMARTPLLDADEMIAALRVGIPENQEYIRVVVGLVESGTLSEKLVYSTFQWARRKRTHKFQYFKAALETQIKNGRGTPATHALGQANRQPF